MDYEARQRIEDLEYRLYNYHYMLAESIAERDRLALDAAWGVHFSLYSTIAAVGIVLTANFVFRDYSWPVGIGVGVALLVAHGAVHSWSNGERMKDVDKLAKLPEWEWKV